MAREDSLIWMIVDYLVQWVKTKKAIAAVLGTFVLLVALAYLFSYQAQAFPAADPYNVTGMNPTLEGPAGAEEETLSVSGYSTEGQAVDESFDLAGDRIWAMEVTFTFIDEATTRPRFTNTPDEFDITVELPDGNTETKSDYATNQAEKTVTFFWNWSAEGGMDWSEDGGNSVNVVVECTLAGDQEPFFTLLNLRDIADNGNDYSLSVFYIYTENE